MTRVLILIVAFFATIAVLAITKQPPWIIGIFVGCFVLTGILVGFFLIRASRTIPTPPPPPPPGNQNTQGGGTTGNQGQQQASQAPAITWESFSKSLIGKAVGIFIIVLLIMSGLTIWRWIGGISPNARSAWYGKSLEEIQILDSLNQVKQDSIDAEAAKPKPVKESKGFSLFNIEKTIIIQKPEDPVVDPDPNIKPEYIYDEDVTYQEMMLQKLKARQPVKLAP